MKTTLSALLLSAVVPLLTSADDVTVWNTFQDAKVTGGGETIYDRDGPTSVGPGFEFVDFPLNFGSDEYGFYAIDVGVNYIAFVLLNNTGATNLVFPDGTYDRYYFTFDEPIAAAEMIDAFTDIDSSVTVLPPGYVMDFENLFHFDIDVPATLVNGGILLEVVPGANLTDLGQTITIAYMHESEEQVAVWNTFQDDMVTKGIEIIYDMDGPAPIEPGVTFDLFPKNFGSDEYGFYDISVGNYIIAFELMNNTGATNLVFPDNTYDRYYFEFSDVVASAELIPFLTDIKTKVEVIPPGFPMGFTDLFGLGISQPATLENGGILLQVLPGANITELGQTILISYRLGSPGIPPMPKKARKNHKDLKVPEERAHKRTRGHHNKRNDDVGEGYRH